MKKLLIIALALVTIQVSAQEKRGEKGRKANLAPEEMAQLQTKQMTLDLDLTEAQQKEVSVINFKKAQMEARKSKKDSEEKPSKEERLQMKNDRLDAQIATKKKMKSILNADQYAKWESKQGKRDHKKGKGKKGGRDRESKEE